MSNFELLFHDIEKRVYRNWNLKDPGHLGRASVTALSENTYLQDFDAGACLSWAVGPGASDLPTQTWHFDFGQPAVTVIRNDDFRIDLLYWLENATAIHDHITCGAFAAVLGDRLHGIYDFNDQQDLDEHVQTGILRRTDFGLMREGDAHEIQPDFIHDLYWLGRPTVTLVVRCTNHEPQPPKPHEYITPGLAIIAKANQNTSLVSRLVEGLALLRQANLTLYAESLQSILESADASLAYYGFLDAAVAAPEALDSVLERVSAPGTALAHLIAARPELVRRSFFGGLYTGDPDAQLAAGLLWADAELKDAADIIRRLNPDDDPAAVLHRAADTYDSLSAQAASEVRALAQRLTAAMPVA
jgi:hypothetical protein